ncbi:MAG: alpha amylase C-terminal domain-containing protein, partial [Gammaproteobacteria bacterium]|nr:alpha amylase C-terminal domain-containing protein [Gammaproteobacteria bacterium]MBU1556288.1 alpha amylase C-terminal domain-containing protein [Gammaproteobacteria bacterium]
QLFRDLNHTYKRCAPLYQLDYQHQGFAWLDHQDAANSTLSFLRRDASGDVIYVLANFTPLPRQDFMLGVEQEGEYQVILNTDSEYYWGSNFDVGMALNSIATPYQGQAQHIKLQLPPLATLYLRKKR